MGCEVKFQPCYVGDIGDAINYIVETETLAKTYELAGPKKYTLYELIKFMLKEVRRKNVIFIYSLILLPKKHKIVKGLKSCLLLSYLKSL